ncbi:autophagy-related protein [Massariosphaeria phaeospora]|uniref:Autophagy-related protein 101 n=1 Tax=Massariosphaeria phaeospora TaxID=100035 RepID=A0A7C8HZP6_9PLEO|nr:autophagy-related protein [Massariosphaeria phaeospora]
MEQRRRPEYNLEIFADLACVKDVVKAILHTIFFHRYFSSISPLTRDLLDLTLPAIDDVDLETLIDQRTVALVRAIDGTRGRGQLVVQFFEKRRRKTYFFAKADEDVCWEQWTLDVTLATPRTESVRRAMTKSLEKAAHKIISIVNRDKDHIPPITTTDANPFPYSVVVNPKPTADTWGPRMGIF